MKAALLTLAALALASCASLGLSPQPLQADQVQRLMARPDFGAASLAAPGWVRDALTVINAQQLRLDTAKP